MQSRTNWVYWASQAAIWCLVVTVSTPGLIGAEVGEPPSSGEVTEDEEGTQSRSERRDRTQAPNLIIGGSAGYAHHFGTVAQIDGVTGASTQVDDRSFADPGFGLGFFLDFGFVDAGPGNIGLTASFLASVPTVYLEVGLSLRYRMRFETRRASRLRAVEPFVGFGAWFAFREEQMSDFYLIIGPSLGVDLELGPPGLYVGFSLDINVVDPVPVTTTETVGGYPVEIEWRLDDVVGALRIGYRFF